jgi:hypothetical protein
MPWIEDRVPLFEHLELRKNLFQVVLSLFLELVATAQVERPELLECGEFSGGLL